MKSQKEMFDEYTEELLGVPGVSMTEDKTQHGIVRKFTSKKPEALAVTLTHFTCGGDFLTLEIDGVDCGWWNTAEGENLEFFIEAATASLKGKVQFHRSPILQRKEGCFLVKDDTWVCVPVRSIFTSFSIRKNIKQPKSV